MLFHAPFWFGLFFFGLFLRKKKKKQRRHFFFRPGKNRFFSFGLFWRFLLRSYVYAFFCKVTPLSKGGGNPSLRSAIFLFYFMPLFGKEGWIWICLESICVFLSMKMTYFKPPRGTVVPFLGGGNVEKKMSRTFGG